MKGVTFPLVEQVLAVEACHDLAPLLRSSWLPQDLPRTMSQASALIQVSRENASPPPPDEPPTLTLGTASLWISATGDSGVLAASGGCWGSLDLPRLRAHLRVPSDGPPTAAVAGDLYSMLTISAALLLGRSGCCLLHAAGVVSPAALRGGNGEAWLLVGDARAGKSTTSVNLITRGWNYLSDDQVILRPGSAAGPIMVEGWLRPFHLDEGWGSDIPLRRRRTVQAARLGPGRRIRTAALGALLFPRVSAAEATGLTPARPTVAMAGLIRQSPWLLADPGAARGLLDLLRRAASVPAYGLTLGLDTFGDAALLEERLAPARRASRRSAHASGSATASAKA
jgi:hypothetical protein